jgi:hypothetical protein
MNAEVLFSMTDVNSSATRILKVTSGKVNVL